MTLTSITSEILDGGTPNGALGCVVRVGKFSPSSDLSTDLILSHINSFVSKYKAKVVKIVQAPTEDEEKNDNQIMELLLVLRDQGFYTLVERSGYRYPQYLFHCSYRIINIVTHDWLKYEFHELRYIPDEDKLPELPKEPKIGIQFLFLRACPIKDAKKLIMKDPRWRVLFPQPKSSVLEVIYENQEPD